MRTLLKALLIQNWPRKCLAIALAISIWFLINQSLTMTKTIENVSIKVENVPKGKVAESSTPDLTLDLTLKGKTGIIEQLNHRNIEIVLNAKGHTSEWIATIQKEDIRATNPQLDISQGIDHIARQNILIKLVNQVSENIPIIITSPIGKPPEGYQLIGIWPQTLTITLTGSETELSKLKSDKVNLTFNLNRIDKKELDHLPSTKGEKREDVVSFSVPSEWKKVLIPQLSLHPLAINDKAAKDLRIDFIREEVLKIDFPIPISLYFPPTAQSAYTVENTRLATSPLIGNFRGAPILNLPLFIKGVSPLFLEIVKNRLELIIIVSPPPNTNQESALASAVQLIDPSALEERYLNALISSDGGYTSHQEAYLRHLFRSYANRLELFLSKSKKLELYPALSGGTVVIKQTKTNNP